MPKRAMSPVLLVPVVALLVGCGGSSSSATASSSSATTSHGGSAPAVAPGGKPSVTVPTGPPPATLESTDLILGTGPAAKSGDMVSVQYVGVSYSTKKQFDASWDRGQPFPFQLGAGMVIPGWDQGVVGMKVGGRRQLVIPPTLAYGERSPGSGIAPNDTLIFVIDMVKIG